MGRHCTWLHIKNTGRAPGLRRNRTPWYNTTKTTRKTLRVLPAVLALVLLLSGFAYAGEAGGYTVPDPGDGHRYQPEWAADAIIYEVNVRQYTPEGTFNAFSEHLQQLWDMGINTLWFMPIHPISETNRSGTLGSYYSITDYRAVNPEFGTEEDFRALVDKAHAMGFHVMMDWVANHTGWDCPWIAEHPDWYTHGAEGQIISPVNMGWPDVADLNYDNGEMREEMIACMRYWVEQFDIDGFRCDYASGVPNDFWETARDALEQVKPVLMLAEDQSAPRLLEKAFDFNYNLDLYAQMKKVAKSQKNANTLAYYIPTNLPDGTYTLNFLDNHDQNSYEITLPSAYGEAVQPLFALIYTIPGTPLVYTGDEIGLDHQLAFMERDPVDWDSTDTDYRGLLAKLAGIKTGNSALKSGNYGGPIEYINTGSKSVLAYTRTKDGNTVACVLNLSASEREAALGDLGAGGTQLLHGVGAGVPETEDVSLGGEGLGGTVTLQPWEYYIIRLG